MKERQITESKLHRHYHALEDRQMRNLLLMVPGSTIDWVRSKVRCSTEHEGFYAEDVRPFGFRVIQAVKNGFVWKTTRLYEYTNAVMYRFDIVDPSQSSIGPATYSWTFSDPTGNQSTNSGNYAFYLANKEQPLDITVSRVRNGVTNTIQMSEPSSNLDSADRPHWLVGLKTPASSVSNADQSHYFNLIPTPNFTSFQFLTNGMFQMQFSGGTNLPHRVLTSTNFVNWQDLGMATQIVAGVFQFVDVDTTNRPQRFYRAVAQ